MVYKGHFKNYTLKVEETSFEKAFFLLTTNAIKLKKDYQLISIKNEHGESYNVSTIESMDIIKSKKDDALKWWKDMGINPILGLIERGELVSKYYGNQRITSSIKEKEIEYMYKKEKCLV